MRNILAIASLVIGLVGIGVFFNPLIEIICGGGGLILALIAKNNNAGKIMRGIRSWGLSLAWINILWVCLEYGLKFAGIDLLG